MSIGVSVVICCHNSAQRLPPTLTHLASQQVDSGISWEAIVVDNASTDGTAQLAQEIWDQKNPAPLRVVHESQLGLSYARYRGLTEAKYEFVSFIDDDNWVCPEWVQLVGEIMSQHPQVGACGGFNEPVFETPPPLWWSDRYQENYATGPQGQEAGEITEAKGFLFGAGLNIRKSAWEKLVHNGFHHLLADRKGRGLSSGGDYELCFALRLADWSLWYDPRLQLRHFLPTSRLQWTYLRRLHRAFGVSSVGFDPYYYALEENCPSLKQRLKRIWLFPALATLMRLFIHSGKFLLLFRYPPEGHYEVLVIENLAGRLSELFRKRKTYEPLIQEVLDARWRAAN